MCQAESTVAVVASAEVAVVKETEDTSSEVCSKKNESSTLCATAVTTTVTSSGLPPPKNLWQAMIDDFVDTRKALAQDMKPNQRRRSFLDMFNGKQQQQQQQEEKKEEDPEEKEEECENDKRNDCVSSTATSFHAAPESASSVEAQEDESEETNDTCETPVTVDPQMESSYTEAQVKPEAEEEQAQVKHEAEEEEQQAKEEVNSNQSSPPSTAATLPPPKKFWQGIVDDFVNARKAVVNDFTKPDKRRRSFLDMMFNKGPRQPQLTAAGEEEEKEKKREHKEKEEDKKEENERKESCTALIKPEDADKERNFWQAILHDFTKGDKKILRAMGRTALVNAVVAISAFTGGAFTSVAGFATGGAITAKRFGDGLRQENPKEVAKSLAVYSCATTASITGQAVAGAVMITVAGASIPVAAAVAFGVGCTSGITAGALSEWGVDHAWEEWGVWLSKRSRDSKTIVGPAPTDAIATSSNLLVDVPMNLLCGPHDEVVKQKLFTKNQDSTVACNGNDQCNILKLPGLHRSDTNATADTIDTMETEAESDSETEGDYNINDFHPMEEDLKSGTQSYPPRSPFALVSETPTI